MTESEQIVYISCVEDVRYSFISHLSEALRRKGINDLFIDSDDLLSEEAQAKVERARVAVMVLPGNRTVFLDKLVKVLECQKNEDQVVVPVLYGVRGVESEWFSALDSKGLSSVHHSREDYTDSELVKEITRVVDEKLFYMERIGINSKLLEIESMVHKQTFGVRCVGIWGMPGIGKTTLAKAVFNQMSGDFDVYCFIEDYDRVIREKGLYRLLEEQFSKEKRGAGGSITKLSLLSNKLINKRVLVVLDDVHNHLMAEPLLGGFDWFGPESLIIIASRDKEVFRLCRVIDHIYEVQGLNAKEALQLFLLFASIRDKKEQKIHHELSMKVIEYANGNPLALNIYGRELEGKKKLSEKVTAFLELKRHPPFKIFDAFKSSYDTLDDSEKNIFLDIACFFNGENVDYVMQLLEGCGFFPHVGIDVLIGKSLVTVSENRVWMHNLVQDVGREIINKETVQIERGSRLWEPSSIKDLLEDDEHKANVDPKTTIKHAQGTEEIQGIFLDTLNLSFDIKTTAFENMLNLRLLKIYCSNPEIHPVINFHNGSVHSLPNELRLLHWENYPAKDLPQKFDPRNLVEINMPYSQLETLWGGTKNLEMLRTIRLRHSQKLVDVDVLLKAKKLEVIDLQGCTKLQSFPATGKLLHLRDVNLSGCTSIRNFPEVPPNIETLHLQGTGIRKLPIVKPDGGKLPSLSEFKGISDALKLERLKSLEKSSSSNQDLGKLICLELKDCSCLRSLPNMVNLEFLKVLDLSGCSELKTILGFPRNLKELYIAGTAVRKVPQLPQSLELFNAHGCLSLKSIRLDSKKLPMHYTFSNCFNLSPSMVSKFLVEALANAKHIPRERQQELNRALAFSFCSPLPADQISTLGLQPESSVMTRLNPSWRNTIVGFAMLVEVAFPEDYCDATGFGIRCVCRWKNKKGHSQRIERNLQCWAPGKAVPKVQNDHIFVFVDVNMRPSTAEGNDPNIWADLVVFEFFPLDDSCKVTGCGVRVINAATGNTSIKDISPVLSLVPMEVSGDEVERVLRVSYDGLLLMNKVLFLHIACLFNDEDVDLVAPLIARNIDLDVNSGLKVLADRSLICASSNGEIGMHFLLRKMGKEILHTKSILPYVPKKSVTANPLEDSSVKGLALGNLVLSSGLLHNSWSKISELHESRPNQDSSCLGINTYQEAKYTLVVFDAKSICRNSPASTFLESETENPFSFLFSEKISSFSVHASAFSLFTSNNERLTDLKSKLLELLMYKKPVIITGAALGGSVASLFTLWLLETIDPRLKRPLCITFGSPLIGDASLQQILDNSVRSSCFLHVADAAKTCIKSDFFKPFGTYLICFGSECICIQNPEAVTELLLNGVDFYQVDYGEVLLRLDQSVLSMTDSKLIPHDVIKRIKAEKPKLDLHKKLKDMKVSMMYLEWYKKMCKKDKIGYYDGFKTETFFSEFKNFSFSNIRNHKINLNDYWKSMVEEVEKKPPSNTSIRRYLFSGNSYRKMMEPLDIAEYYLDGRKEYRTLGRSHHYVMLEKWFEKERRDIDIIRDKNRDLSDLLTFDSCFWAEVEESLIVINLLKTTVGMRDRELLTRHLVRFEEYVWGMIIKREVSPEIFLEKSCFMRWWKEYKAIKGSISSPSDFMEYMNTGKYESYGQPMNEKNY